LDFSCLEKYFFLTGATVGGGGGGGVKIFDFTGGCCDSIDLTGGLYFGALGILLVRVFGDGILDGDKTLEGDEKLQSKTEVKFRQGLHL